MRPLARQYNPSLLGRVFGTGLKMFFDLTTDPLTGRFLGTKIGEVVAGMTWTFYMLMKLPDDWEMWLAFAGTIMGWSSVKYRLRTQRTAEVGTEDPEDPDAPPKEK